MKTVFTANKSSYGSAFMSICNSLQELKECIVNQDYMFDEHKPVYSEELFKQKSYDYILYKVELHDDEEIIFNEYDGQSWFQIVKKHPNILSKSTLIDKNEDYQLGA